MSRKYPLTTQTAKLFIVIRKPFKVKEGLIKEYCEKHLDEYAFIEHKNDIDAITGETIPSHWHIFGKAKKSKTPLSTHLNDILKFLRFDDANGIEIDKWENDVLSLQYLIHKNNPEKTAHSIDEVKTNIPQEQFRILMLSETGEYISFDFVYTICLRSKNIIEVIRDIGFKQYSRYRNTIRDIFDEIKKV